MSIAIIIFELVVLLFSAILHEIAHGYMAERLGDDTARRAGRLTLNPLVHLDPFFSILMPLLLFWSTGIAFGGAKPVPYNPNNLRDPRKGSLLIALAGPATNLLLAAIFGIIIRTVALVGTPGTFLDFFGLIVYINLILGIFNLVPIPPLDGSRILFALLPRTETTVRVMYMLERWGFFLVILFVFFGFSVLIPIIQSVFVLFTGQSLGI